MAQTYQMNHNPQGTIYSLLTVESDGQMTMTFHGTDREISHEATEDEDGWLCYPGAMYPGLQSGKWQAVAMPETTTDNTDCTDNEPFTMNHAPLIVNQPAHTKRQRKARKAAAPVRRSIETSRQRDIETQEPTTEWLRSAGYLAAASVALLVIWQTGLIIPLGLIGLATSGLLK